jgi:NADPH:quinone reductase-like Zn-dependent oxidoreductase
VSGLLKGTLSPDDDKIKRAVALGAKGGVNYKNPTWPKQLEQALKGKRFDAIVDGSSGPNTQQYLRLLKQGGIISVFGAVAGSASTIVMPHLWFASAQIRGFRGFRVVDESHLTTCF